MAERLQVRLANGQFKGMGGLGSAGGTLIGALIIGVMKNGLDILNVSADYQQIARAIIIVVAVTIDVRKNARRS